MARRQPIDLAALINAKRAEDAARAKPKFLSVEERGEREQALALERRAKAVEDKYRHHQAQARAHDAHPDGGYAAREGTRDEPPPRKKVRTNNDPRKVKFDWNEEDDTSRPDALSYEDRRHDRAANGHGSATTNGTHGSASSRDRSDIVARLDPDRAARMREFEARHGSRRIASEDIHWSAKPLCAMKERDWRILKEDFGIQTKGGAGVPQPLRSWSDAALSPQLLRVIDEVGYREPSPIQRATIPVGLAGRDIIGIAETGSGKTASFVLPMLEHIATLPPLTHANKNDGPYAVVLAPTRELAQQIEQEAARFARPMGFNVVSIVGGRAIEQQSWNLRDGAEILVATPGRLLDCIDRHVLVLNQCYYIVMDEADRMVDLGFEQAVNDILDALPAKNAKPDNADLSATEQASAAAASATKGAADIDMPDAATAAGVRYRQTVMFSATMPAAVEKLARKYLRRPVTVVIGNAGQAVETVSQRVEVCEGDDRRRKRLAQILQSGEFDKPVVVFCNTKKQCEAVARFVQESLAWRAVVMHGAKSQEQRESALAKLRAGQADCLVATDLAGRGIDVPGVSLVLNFQMARSIEDYVHRIGRTGRAGRKGTAITFVGDADSHLFYAIKTAAKNSPHAQLPQAIRQAVKPNAAILAAAQAAQNGVAGEQDDD